MLDSIEIRNFQSLQKVDLELAPFTVIVGPSSSGKSAFVRALSTLVSNRRGTDFISHGTTTSVITARMPEGTTSLSRSTIAAKNQYTLISPEGKTENFTKLGGDIPEEVSRFMRIPAKDPVTLAQQFDKPFLLAVPVTGADGSWRNEIEANPLASVTCSQVFRHDFESGLRSRVGVAAEGSSPIDRTDHDDIAAGS